jgi:hypothetical protein
MTGLPDAIIASDGKIGMLGSDILTFMDSDRSNFFGDGGF